MHSTPTRTQRDALLADHRWMDDQLVLLTRAFAADDQALIATTWEPLERFLVAHMEAEERDLYPSLGRWSPECVLSLVQEHAEIRAAVSQVGIALELHVARSAAVEELAALLRQHARREDVLLFGILAGKADETAHSRLAGIAH